MSANRVLVVCTANICRSPLAERLLAEYFARHAPEVDLQVTSAGTRARPGYEAASGMQTIAEAWGLDLSYHRSRRVDADIAAAHDLVITMERRHSDAVSRLTAGLGQRVFTITELDGIIAGPRRETAGPGLAAQVAAWHAARARLNLDAPDVVDPYGGTAEEYEQVAWQLAELVERIGPAVAEAAG